MATTYVRAWESVLFEMVEQARHPAIPRTPVPVADAELLGRAYRRCEAIIAEHGKTFNMTTALLPPAKRRAMRALYAFCRVTDNIVDSPEGTVEDKQAELARWRYRSMAACPPRQDLVATAWADTRLRYGIPYKYGEQLIEGVARDLHQQRYQSFDDLATYAYSVASTVGLMSLRIIGLAPGFREEDAIPYAIKLGLALQITNILRDVGEDWRAGRVYLPAHDLEAWGISEGDFQEGHIDERWRGFMRFQIERNRQLYEEGWPCIAMFNHDGRFGMAAMCALYSVILSSIEANNYDVFNHRAHVSTWGKLSRLPGIWVRNCYATPSGAIKHERI
jgi:15-cis-phytoene synthase